jgi:hypothetical protein
MPQLPTRLLSLDTALLAVGVGSGTNREECLNPRGIRGNPRVSVRSGHFEPVREGAANRELLTPKSVGGSVDRTQEVGGSSPPSSIAREPHGYAILCSRADAPFARLFGYVARISSRRVA